ncbi:MAG: SdrD B-like domain-containing protein, partial [Gemmataceae bacterium]
MRSPFDGINKKRHLEAAMGISTSEITQRFYRKLLRKASLKQSSLSKKLQFSTLEDRLQPAGTITGTTFLDYNANGVYNSTALTIPNASGVGSVALAADVGIGGVTVTAYDAAGVIQGTATSNTNGSYTLNAAGTGPYRIEFSNLPTGTVFGPSTTSAASGVQFVQDGTTGNVNLSVVRPESISSTTSPAGPQLVTQQYWFGSHDATRADGMNAAQATILDFNYNAGSADSDPNAANYQAPQTHNLASPFSAVGATWGLAFNPASNSIYASAFAKRYSDFGPSGPGAIYQINGTSGTSASQVSTLVDLNAIFPSDLPAGKNFRTDPSWTGFANDGLTNNLGWGAIGTTGLGGLTVSPDGSRIFVIALGNRKLYSIPTSGPINASTIQSFTLPTPTNLTGVNVGTNGTLGDLRPFAVEYHNGKIYVGAVNSAQSTGNANDLKAYVFAFDPTTGNFVDAAGTATTTT